MPMPTETELTKWPMVVAEASEFPLRFRDGTPIKIIAYHLLRRYMGQAPAGGADTKNAAEKLGVSRKTIYNWCATWYPRVPEPEAPPAS